MAEPIELAEQIELAELDLIWLMRERLGKLGSLVSPTRVQGGTNLLHEVTGMTSQAQAQVRSQAARFNQDPEAAHEVTESGPACHALNADGPESTYIKCWWAWMDLY